MPYYVCKKLNATLTQSSIHIIQLDRYEVKVIGELKDVLIRVASNPKVHQVIDIVVVDMPKACGFLSVGIGPKSYKVILHQIGHIFGYHGMVNRARL
jgi:hypothetical protein